MGGTACILLFLLFFSSQALEGAGKRVKRNFQSAIRFDSFISIFPTSYG